MQGPLQGRTPWKRTLCAGCRLIRRRPLGRANSKGRRITSAPPAARQSSTPIRPSTRNKYRIPRCDDSSAHARGSSDLARIRMYTRESVKVYLRPATVCILLLFGAGPAVTLACELACSDASGHAHHQPSHHNHSSEAVHASHTAGETPSITSFATKCDHAIAVAPAVTSMPVKVFAPVAVQTFTLASPASAHAGVTPFGHAIGGPPGVRSGPISLRI